jgi:hypothetical protein
LTVRAACRPLGRARHRGGHLDELRPHHHHLPALPRHVAAAAAGDQLAGGRRPDAQTIIAAIKETPPETPIDLILHTPGGLVLAAMQIARAVEAHPAQVTVYVPVYAMSGGTLIVEAYDALGDAAAAAAAGAGRSPRKRWVAAALAVRAWALAHPHEYALLYGTPVPGYEAPTATVDPGTRVSRLLVGIVHEAGVTEVPGPSVRLARDLRAELRRTADLVAPGMAVEVLFAALLAWTQLFGTVSFEVFGQTRGIVEAHDALFEAAAEHAAASLGL